MIYMVEGDPLPRSGTEPVPDFTLYSKEEWDRLSPQQRSLWSRYLKMDLSSGGYVEVDRDDNRIASVGEDAFQEWQRLTRIFGSPPGLPPGISIGVSNVVDPQNEVAAIETLDEFKRVFRLSFPNDNGNHVRYRVSPSGEAEVALFFAPSKKRAVGEASFAGKIRNGETYTIGKKDAANRKTYRWSSDTSSWELVPAAVGPAATPAAPPAGGGPAPAIDPAVSAAAALNPTPPTSRRIPSIPAPAAGITINPPASAGGAPRPDPRPAPSPGTPLTEHERRIQSEREQTELARAQAERARAETDLARAELERDNARVAAVNAAAARVATGRLEDTPRAESTEAALRTINQIIRGERQKLSFIRYIFSKDFLYTAGTCAAVGVSVSLLGAATFGLGGVGLAVTAGSASGAVRGIFERNKARKILDAEKAAARVRNDEAAVRRIELEEQKITKDALVHGWQTTALGALFGAIGYSAMEYSGVRGWMQNSFFPFLLGTGTGAGGAKLAGAAIAPPNGGGGRIPGILPPPGAPRNLPPGMMQGPRAPRPPVCVWETHCRGVRMRCVPQEVLYYQRMRGSRCPTFFEPYAYRMRAPGRQIVECFPQGRVRVGTPFMYDVFPGARPGNNVWSFMQNTVGVNVRGPRVNVVTQYYWEELTRMNPNSVRKLGIVSGNPSLIGQTYGQQVNLQRFFADERVLENILRRPRLSQEEVQGIFKTYFDANASMNRRTPITDAIVRMWAETPQMRGRNFIPPRTRGGLV